MPITRKRMAVMADVLGDMNRHASAIGVCSAWRTRKEIFHEFDGSNFP
jgi:hypothetical protein